MTPKEIDAKLHGLPAWYGHRELLEALGGWDNLIDAYCDQTLPGAACRALEDSISPDILHCQLLRRQVRILLEISRKLDPQEVQIGVSADPPELTPPLLPD